MWNRAHDNRDNYQNLLDKAKEALKQDLRESIALYDGALAERPDGHEALWGRAYAYLMLNNYSEAVSDYTRILQFGVTDVPTLCLGYKPLQLGVTDIPEVYANRGFAKYKQGDMAGAADDIAKAIQLEPNSFIHYSNRGIVKFENDDIPGGLEDFNKALGMNTDFAEGYYNRGLALYRMGKKSDAFIDFQKAIQLKSSFDDELNGLM